MVVFGILPLLRRPAPLIEALRERLGLTDAEMKALQEKAITASALLGILLSLVVLRDRTEKGDLIHFETAAVVAQ